MSQLEPWDDLPDESPLLGLISLLAPALAMGNTYVLCHQNHFLWNCLVFAQVIETSDLPAGVVNLVTAKHEDVTVYLAGHMELDARFGTGSSGLSPTVEKLSANLKHYLGKPQ